MPWQSSNKTKFNKPCCQTGKEKIFTGLDLYRLLDGLVMGQFVPHKNYTMVSFRIVTVHSEAGLRSQLSQVVAVCEQ